MGSNTDAIIAAMEKRRKRLEAWLRSPANKPVEAWPPPKRVPRAGEGPVLEKGSEREKRYLERRRVIDEAVENTKPGEEIDTTLFNEGW